MYTSLRLKEKEGDTMHSYLRAIGFSNIKNRADLEKIIGIVMDRPTEKKSIQMDEKVTLTEYRKDFLDGIGLAIVGEYDEKGFFHLDHYYPYYKGKYIATKEEVVINKRVDTDGYTGMCDDMRLGVSLIFYLQNVIDFLECKRKYFQKRIPYAIVLTGMAMEGKILLGIHQPSNNNKTRTAEMLQRKKLIAEAKMGNQEAIDSLTIEDIDTYAMVSRRVKNEDIYSIVETSFVPYGSESDNYSIVGTIMDLQLIKNEITQEEVYQMLLNCNDIVFQICINKQDLQGVPMINRRFKGNIWMQGHVDFYGNLK